MSTLTAITSCQTTTCAFNNDGCAAPAITIGGHNGASCRTFVELDARGGLATPDGQVGACQQLECVHNSALMCSAPSITVGDDGSCLSYSAA